LDVSKQAGTPNGMVSLRAAVIRHVLYCSGCWMYPSNDHPAGCSGPLTRKWWWSSARAQNAFALNWQRGAHHEQHRLVGRSNRHHSRDTGIPRLQVTAEYRQSSGKDPPERPASRGLKSLTSRDPTAGVKDRRLCRRTARGRAPCIAEMTIARARSPAETAHRFFRTDFEGLRIVAMALR
jgi:hypothetical protein